MSITTENVTAAAPAPEAEQPTTEAPKQVEEQTTAEPAAAAAAPAVDANADAKVREPLACS